MTEIWIAGFPSPCGGADTELDHQIDLFRRQSWDVHLVPMHHANEALVADVEGRGCHVHAYRDDIFAGKIVASWCNGNFLEALPRIMYAGRPAKVIWFNCMTWLFDREIDAHARAWIDIFGFVSSYQRRVLEPELAAIGPTMTFSYRPWFNHRRFDSRYRRWNGSYRIGRLSRDDAAKYSDDTWRIFEAITVPKTTQKSIRIMGFGPNARAKLGEPPAGLPCSLLPPNALPAHAFLAGLDTLLHCTGGSRESYGRAVVEAMASAVVPIVENDYAFPELIVDGETGFLANSPEEMIERASWLAHHPDEHERIARAAVAHVRTLADDKGCASGWTEILRD